MKHEKQRYGRTEVTAFEKRDVLKCDTCSFGLDSRISHMQDFVAWCSNLIDIGTMQETEIEEVVKWVEQYFYDMMVDCSEVQFDR